MLTWWFIMRETLQKSYRLIAGDWHQRNKAALLPRRIFLRISYWSRFPKRKYKAGLQTCFLCEVDSPKCWPPSLPGCFNLIVWWLCSQTVRIRGHQNEMLSSNNQAWKGLMFKKNLVWTTKKCTWMFHILYILSFWLLWTISRQRKEEKDIFSSLYGQKCQNFNLPYTGGQACENRENLIIRL